MSFIEQKNMIAQFILQNKQILLSESDYSLFNEIRIEIESIRKVAVDHLCDDLTQKRNDFIFQNSLNYREYTLTNIEAVHCIDLTLRARELPERKTLDWTSHALKCFDNILIKYLNEGLNEKIPQSRDKIYETEVYGYFEDKDDPALNKVGTMFKAIYQKISNLMHIQYTNKEGYRQVKDISLKKLKIEKNDILDFFKIALDNLLPLYKTHYYNKKTD